MISDVNAAADLTFTIKRWGRFFVARARWTASKPACRADGHRLHGNDGTSDGAGSLSAINAALQTGVIYTPGSGNHTLTMTVSDPIGGIVSQSITVPAQGTVQGPTAGTASIFISDTSHGTAGLVLDDQTPSVLTTAGTMPFTDSGTHTVKAVALPAIGER